MKTLTTFALLTALVVGTSASAHERVQDKLYYGGAMCGTSCSNECAEPCTPACRESEPCCATYHKKCYWDSCNCVAREVCCRDVKGILTPWLGI